MSEVIEFLERLGSDARLRHASNEEVGQALAEAGIEDPTIEAILWGDRRTLESLLGAKANVFCGVLAPDEEKEDDQEDDGADEEQEDEGEDDEEVD